MSPCGSLLPSKACGTSIRTTFNSACSTARSSMPQVLDLSEASRGHDMLKQIGCTENFCVFLATGRQDRMWARRLWRLCGGSGSQGPSNRCCRLPKCRRGTHSYIHKWLLTAPFLMHVRRMALKNCSVGCRDAAHPQHQCMPGADWRPRRCRGDNSRRHRQLAVRLPPRARYLHAETMTGLRTS